MATEKPILDTTSKSTKFLIKERKRAMRYILEDALCLSGKEKRKVTRVLHKWRKKQRELLGHRDIEDPNPFDKTYVFYCLDT